MNNYVIDTVLTNNGLGGKEATIGSSSSPNVPLYAIPDKVRQKVIHSLIMTKFESWVDQIYTAIYWYLLIHGLCVLQASDSFHLLTCFQDKSEICATLKEKQSKLMMINVVWRLVMYAHEYMIMIEFLLRFAYSLNIQNWYKYSDCL